MAEVDERAESQAGGDEATCEAVWRRIDELNAQALECRRVDHARLLSLSEEALRLASKPTADGAPYERGLAAALANLAYHRCISGNWSEAMAKAAQVIQLLSDDEPCHILADAHAIIGWSNFCKGDHAEGLKQLLQGLEIAEQAGDPRLQGYLLDAIGRVQQALGEPAAATETHLRALEIHRELGNELGEALALNHLARAQIATDDLSGARDSIEASIRYAREANLEQLLVSVLQTAADVRLCAGRLDEAESLGDEALALARECECGPNEVKALILLGRIAAKRERWPEARRRIGDALAMAERLSLSVEVYACHRLLSEIYEQTGDFAEALEHFKHFHELKEARTGQDTRSRLASMHLSHQMKSARKDAELHRLRSLALEHEVEERRLAQTALEAQASLDPLTGLHNRGYFALLAAETGIGETLDRPVSLLMIDIDHFKDVNDSFGHLTGDRVLGTVAGLIRNNCRQSDVACRYGGDEFLLLLDGMESSDAARVAERLREMISRTRARFQGRDIEVAVSVGVATAPPGAKWRLGELIQQTDSALYEAKHTGRNRVVVSDAAEPPEGE